MPVVAFAKCIFNGYPSLIMASLREARRFNKAYAKDTSKGLKQIESRMMYFTHQIEKGLSHQLSLWIRQAAFAVSGQDDSRILST